MKYTDLRALIQEEAENVVIEAYGDVNWDRIVQGYLQRTNLDPGDVEVTADQLRSMAQAGLSQERVISVFKDAVKVALTKRNKPAGPQPESWASDEAEADLKRAMSARDAPGVKAAKEKLKHALAGGTTDSPDQPGALAKRFTPWHRVDDAEQYIEDPETGKMIATGKPQPDDPRRAATGTSVDKAEKLNDEGKFAYRDGNFAEAEKIFRRAWRAHRDPRYAFNLASAWARQGKTEQAVNVYKFYLRKSPNDPQNPKIRELVARLESGGCEKLSCVPHAKLRAKLAAAGGAGVAPPTGAPPAGEAETPDAPKIKTRGKYSGPDLGSGGKKDFRKAFASARRAGHKYFWFDRGKGSKAYGTQMAESRNESPVLTEACGPEHACDACGTATVEPKRRYNIKLRENKKHEDK